MANRLPSLPVDVLRMISNRTSVRGRAALARTGRVGRSVTSEALRRNKKEHNKLFKFTNVQLRNIGNPRWQAYWNQFSDVPALRKAFRAAALRLHPDKQRTLPGIVFIRHMNLYRKRLRQLSP